MPNKIQKKKLPRQSFNLNIFHIFSFHKNEISGQWQFEKSTGGSIKERPAAFDENYNRLLSNNKIEVALGIDFCHVWNFLVSTCTKIYLLLIGWLYTLHDFAIIKIQKHFFATFKQWNDL